MPFLKKHLKQQQSSSPLLWAKPCFFIDHTVVFCFGCQAKVPISDKELEDVVIFLTSSKRGNYVSSEELMECQKQWLEMRKGQPKETSKGERRTLGWESLSISLQMP